MKIYSVSLYVGIDCIHFIPNPFQYKADFAWSFTQYHFSWLFIAYILFQIHLYVNLIFLPNPSIYKVDFSWNFIQNQFTWKLIGYNILFLIYLYIKLILHRVLFNITFVCIPIYIKLITHEVLFSVTLRGNWLYTIFYSNSIYIKLICMKFYSESLYLGIDCIQYFIPNPSI